MIGGLIRGWVGEVAGLREAKGWRCGDAEGIRCLYHACVVDGESW